MAEHNASLKRQERESTDAEPSPKRSRPNESNTAGQEKPRHPTLWFDDGGIVLSAEHTLFRVHRSFLSLNSPIFRDLFSIPPRESASEDPEETWEGLPLIRMHDDDEDIVNLLTALYDRTYSLASQPIDVVAGLLRMSTKYEIGYLRNQAIKYLTPIYDLPNRNIVERYTATTRGVQFAPLIINTARETKTDFLIPGAFFFLAIQDINHIFERITKEERPRYRISMDDLQTCITGREALIKCNRETIYSFGSKKCGENTRCNSRMNTFVQSEVWKEHVADPNTTAVLDSAFWNDITVCGMCVETHRMSSRMGVRKVIDQVPGYFKFSDWDTLRKSTKGQPSQIK
ncbi:hypothetical protein BD410DRAFT_771991 [Rickenella mellea]|uniref:BTB domain-containing protein n=1 Tax=Rickenella mellea TaxID=50990 RepID=A0A4Y7Q0I9_9AGAM|nr:hypothetical protein BD410DRAFT_771991 [Rickenella mellea]